MATLRPKLRRAMKYNRDANQRGKKRVEGEDYERGGTGVGAEEFEDCREQVGIYGRHPGGGPGLEIHGVAVAVSGGDGARDAANFKAE